MKFLIEKGLRSESPALKRLAAAVQVPPWPPYSLLLARIYNPGYLPIQEFRTRRDLQDRLRVSFLRMMNFYGFETRFGKQITITRAPNFAAKAAGWLSPSNHNHLRITRILKCLTVLGLEAEAKAFFGCLSGVYDDEQSKPMPAISEDTMQYWRKALGDAGGV
jgi:hypothetical protein